MPTKEKRKHARVNSLNLSYFCLDQNDKIVKQGMGRTLNVSESGILLETPFPIDSNHTVLLNIGLEEDIVDIKGKPIHSKTNDLGLHEVGIQFLKISETTRKKLKKYIEVFVDKKDEAGTPE